MVEDLSSVSEAEFTKRITADSALVAAYMNGCPACEMFEPVFKATAKSASLVCKFFRVERGSRNMEVLDRLVKSAGLPPITGYPTTVVMCVDCSRKGSKPVKTLVGARDQASLIKEALNVCSAMSTAPVKPQNGNPQNGRPQNG